MKRIKKLTAVLFIVILALSTNVIFEGKEVRAEGYVSAPELSFSGNWSEDRYITENEHEHWYKIVIPSDGECNIRIMSYISSMKWEVHNQDFSEVLKKGDIYHGSETAPKTESTYISLSKGTYYCKVYASYAVGRYKLYSSFESYDVNDIGADSYDSPLVYQLGDTITGALTRTDYEDWYKIDILSEGYYTQKIVSYLSRLDWELYNWDLSEKIRDNDIYGGSDTKPVTKTNDFVLSKGTYYIKIDTSGYSFGKYLFQFCKLTKRSCTHDYKITYHNATYFSKGYTKYQCEKCGHTYKGNYVSVRKLSQGYLYSYCSTGKGKMNLSWSTIYSATGYQIRYSKDRSFKDGTIIKKLRGQSRNSKVISGLSRRKNYYVQVRAYKSLGSKTVYGEWSNRKCLKTK